MARATLLLLPGGERRGRVLRAGDQVELFARILHADAEGLCEVAAATRTPEGRLSMRPRRLAENYLRAGDRRALRLRAMALSRAALEVFATPAVLGLPEPGNDSVVGSRVAWVDVDDPHGLGRLRSFGRRPHLVVASGSGFHAYWRLARIVDGEEVERLNRTLAAALGADRQSTNRGRLMRCPGTRNWKGGRARWCRALAADLALPDYKPEQLVEGLEDPAARVRRRIRRWRAQGEDMLADRVSPPEYFRRLAGVEVPPDGGLVRCLNPAHPDRHPSMQVFADAGQGFFCWSCGVGGSVYDLQALITGRPTGTALRGEEFKQVRREVRRALGVEEPGDGATPRSGGDRPPQALGGKHPGRTGVNDKKGDERWERAGRR